MATKYKQLLWQIPVIVVISVAINLFAIWIVRSVFGFNMDASAVAVLSVVISISVSLGVIGSDKRNKS